MARVIPALSSDDQRALQHAVSDTVAGAQATESSTQKRTKKKKKHARDEAASAGEEGVDVASSKKKKKKRSERDEELVQFTEGANEVVHKKKKKKKREGQPESVQQPEHDLVMDEQPALEDAAAEPVPSGDGLVNPPDVSAAPLKKKKRKKDKGKQPAAAEPATPLDPPDLVPAELSMDNPYTNPQVLMATLLSMAPSLSQQTPSMDPGHPPPGYAVPHHPPYLSHTTGQPAGELSMPDFNQLLADLSSASGEPAMPDSGPGSNTSAEDLIRLLEALSAVDPSKIPGVLQTFNDAAAQHAAPQPVPSGVPIGIPMPGALPPGHARALPGRLNPRTRANLAVAQSFAPTPINQAPRSSASIVGGQTNLSTHIIVPAGFSPGTSDTHLHLLAHKWLTSTALNDLVKKEGLVYKKGKFSRVEDQLLEEAINTYARENGLTMDQMREIIFAKDKAKEATFWTDLTQAVPGRPITAVYHHIRRIYHPLSERGGEWTVEEDARLRQAYLQHGPAWERVSQVVGRMAVHCRDRHRNHIAEQEIRNTGAWSKEEEDELYSIMTELIARNGEQDEIFWGKVSQLMGGKRGRQQCRGKWIDQLSLRMKTNNEGSRWSTHDAYILIHKINSLNVQHDSEIDWKTLSDPNWNLWSPHLMQLRWRTMKEGVKGWEDMTHAEIMNVLLEKKGQVPPAVKHSQQRRVTSAQEIQPEMDHDEPSTSALFRGAITPSTIPLGVAPRHKDEAPTIPEATQQAGEGKVGKKKKRKHRNEEEDGDVPGAASVVNPVDESAKRKKKKKRSEQQEPIS